MEVGIISVLSAVNMEGVRHKCKSNLRIFYGEYIPHSLAKHIVPGLYCVVGRIHPYFYHARIKAMHLNIKNDEAHKLASELARLTGESLTSAVTLALRERLARERRRFQTDRIVAGLMTIGSEFAALADTGRSPDEILGYDDHGLPT
jgi:antitoxin VapB